MKKICPTCKKQFSELDRYCTKCGIELVKEPNRCSAMKTALCKDKIFEDDDMFCSACGAPTIYWKDDIEERKRW